MRQGPSEYCSVTEAAAVLGMSRRAIYTWMHAGKLKYVVTPGGRRRIRRADLTRRPQAPSTRGGAAPEAVNVE